MHQLLHGIRQFGKHVFHEQREFFAELVHGQNPQALFVTCSDLRASPSLLTQTEPGEPYVLLNVRSWPRTSPSPTPARG